MFEDESESGYDVVGEAGAIVKAAAKQGVRVPMQLAQALAARGISYGGSRPVAVRPIQQGQKTGMATGLPLGGINFPAASVPGAVLNLAAVAQERFVARRLILQRYNQWVPAAATPMPGCAGQQVSVLDVRIGQRSVLAGGAGPPVETFDPKATGGGMLATGAEVVEGKTVTVQIQFNGPGNVPAAESISVTGYLAGED